MNHGLRFHPKEGSDMHQRTLRDAGETLVEIVITIVIVSLAVTALIAGLGTAAGAAKAHKDLALSDTVMRNYAEATKRAAATCTPGGTYNVVYTPPTNFGVSVSPDGGVCPALDATQALLISVTTPVGVKKTMQIKVRTP